MCLLKRRRHFGVIRTMRVTCDDTSSRAAAAAAAAASEDGSITYVVHTQEVRYNDVPAS